jgi:hypothetical protein
MITTRALKWEFGSRAALAGARNPAVSVSGISWLMPGPNSLLGVGDDFVSDVRICIADT